MLEFNHNRVIYYGRGDYATYMHRERIRMVLPSYSCGHFKSVNDAIEAHQAKLIIDALPELFKDVGLTSLGEQVSRAFAGACRFLNNALSTTNVLDIYEQIERQYAKQFWELITACGAFHHIQEESLGALIDRYPNIILRVLDFPVLVRRFDKCLRRSMCAHPKTSAQIIIDKLATTESRYRSVALPNSLTSDDMDSILLAYLGSGKANLNYAEVLTHWPDRDTKSVYCPSTEVRVMAHNIIDEGRRGLFADNANSHVAFFHISVGATLDPNQHACKTIMLDGTNITYSFSMQWLQHYTDSATVMNNCLYVFDYLDNHGLMTMPVHRHEESGISALLGLRVLSEYRQGPITQLRENAAVAETVAYASFLESGEHSLERALEWVYTNYFHEEYGIGGFCISLPGTGDDWLTKCKAIGVEIERAAKEYQLYAKNGCINDTYFRYERFKSFSDLPSLSEEAKYAIEGESFLPWAQMLFSDQSPLVYATNVEGGDSSFFSLMQSTLLTRFDYPPEFRNYIDRLREAGFLTEDEPTGRLTPTPEAHYLGLVWDNGALCTRLRGDEATHTIDALVNRGILKYHRALLTPDEASYLNYMLNDSEQTNARALRNKYNHASFTGTNSNVGEMRNDYYTMLALFISLTLKINHELAYANRKGVELELVEWPLYDTKSVTETAQKLGTFEPSAQCVGP